MILANLFVLANLVIVAGYLLVAVGIAPHFRSDTPVTRVGGVLFFMLCGATHLEFVAHYAAGSGISLDEFGSLHMTMIHAPQAVAVLWFISGLYLDQKVPVVVGSPTLVVVVDRILIWLATNRVTLAAARAIDRRLFGFSFGLALAIAGAGALESI